MYIPPGYRTANPSLRDTVLLIHEGVHPTDPDYSKLMDSIPGDVKAPESFRNHFNSVDPVFIQDQDQAKAALEMQKEKEKKIAELDAFVLTLPQNVFNNLTAKTHPNYYKDLENIYENFKSSNGKYYFLPPDPNVKVNVI